MRIKMPAVRIAQADSDTTEQPEVTQDILTCGSCQKTFALSDIVKFIQHKVLQCNKENYGQCFSQAGSSERDPDDGRPLGLVNRRPSISAPISARKPSGSRVHSPLPTSPSELLIGDGASSTPKRLADEEDSSTKRPSSASPLGSSLDEENRRNLQIKQERLELSSSHEEASSISSGQPLKRSRTDVTDAESNTINSEPTNYVCSTCKTRLYSAWRLVEHVQHAHGVKIYIESNSNAATGQPQNQALTDLSGSSTCSSTSSSVSSSQISQQLNIPTSLHQQVQQIQQQQMQLSQQKQQQQQQQQQQPQAIRSTNMQRSIIEMLPSSVPPNKHPLSIEYSRGMRTDVSLVPPIRQTASIFKQPVTVYKTQDSKSKADLKHGTLDKPNQLFWAKRLEGLRACDVDGVELGPVELPKGLKPVGPNVDDGTLLQSVATSLHVTSQAVTGQQASKAVLQMNPGVFLNPDQPLMHSVNINEDDIRRQEDRVQVARRKLQEALKC